MNTSSLRLPVLTFGVAAVAIVATGIPAIGASAVGERAALIDGEFWRLWTAHLVHFSRSHLFWSGTVWLAAASWVERTDRRALAGMLIAAAPIVASVPLLCDGDMVRYGGLSGLACAPLAWIAALLIGRSSTSHRALGLCILGLLIAKIGFEARGDARSLLANFDPALGEVRSAMWAHIAGLIAGIIACIAHKRRPSPQSITD